MLTAFFFFFYSSSFALVEMFFIAEVLTKVFTIEFILFWGKSFIFYGFFCCFNAYYSSAVYCWFYCFYGFSYYCCGEYFWPWRGSIDFISVVITKSTLEVDDVFVGEVERWSVVRDVLCLLRLGFVKFAGLAEFTDGEIAA